MTQIFSIKSAATLCVATVAMCFAGNEANAQCGYGGYRGFSPGFGGSAISIGYSSGFRGASFGYNSFGGFGNGVSVGVYRPAVPVYRPANLYGGFYGRPVGGININYVSPRNRNYHHHGHRHW